ncbi:tRNA:m4X modification enzyme [Basidiobolus ranarum]|uniref:tRNA:m(4)X modification enzyme TRM13 n=1 Tax=Basidiobolus ranarum TaxID=34480 RepID=A0ABR2WTR9_9FUNG
MTKKHKATEEPIPPPPNKPGQCNFWVKRKRRFCHLKAKQSNQYCGEHLVHQDNLDRKRVPCPFDPSHSVFESELEKHMESKCNSRPPPPRSCFSKNINVTLSQSIEEIKPKTLLSSLDKASLQDIIDKVRRIYTEQLPELQKEVLDHDALKDRLQVVTTGRKHAIQQASLLGHMRKQNLLIPDACFVEFGAGRGELSNYLHKATANGSQGTYVLIDRKKCRGKFDSAIRGEGGIESTVERIWMDIKDLDLSCVDTVKGKPIVALSKHLCGAATDLTLKCLMNYYESQKNSGILGIVIALCCHQVCRYNMYPNQEYLLEIGLTQDEFQLLTSMSSWAICGQMPKEGEEPDEHTLECVEAEDIQQGQTHYSGLSHEEREKIGRQCKRIFDMGRVTYLQKHGFDARLVYYVDKDISLENLALVAVPKKSPLDQSTNP